MRILFLLLAMPFPPKSGQQVRNQFLLRALVEEGHHVSLVSFAGGEGRGPQRREAERVCEGVGPVDLVPLPATATGGWGYASRLRAMASSLPHSFYRFRSEGMAAAVRKQLARERFDAIICDGIYLLANLPPSPSAPVLLNKDDITYEILQRYIRFERNPLKVAYGWLECRKVRNWERQACSMVSGVLANSERERDLLAQLCPGAKFAIVPNAIDTDSYSPGSGDDGTTVLFVGAMDWFPNQDAVGFFVREALPELRKLAPKAKFVVAGRNPPPRFQAGFAGMPGVEFTGTVADVRPLLERAAVCVAPLRIGSGTRIKILEAAAMAKPIVSTRLGAEGLEFADGEEIVLADDPISFSRAVADLLAQPSRRQALGRAARRRMTDSYGLAVLREALRTALAEFVASPDVSQQCSLAAS